MRGPSEVPHENGKDLCLARVPVAAFRPAFWPTSLGGLMPRFVLALLASWWLLLGNACAQTRVDVELVLAVDISLSMDWDELRLQRGGYAAALRDPELHKLIARGPRQRIAVTYFEWAGTSVQKVIAPWTLIDSAAAAQQLADVIEQAPISRERMTSISAAIDFSSRLFDQSPYRGERRVLDISGDGPNNAGRPVVAARDALLEKGISINGLPIILKSGGTVFDLASLDLYYNDCVIGGPAAFVIAIKREDEFVPAIRRKLLLEIAGVEPPSRLVRIQAKPDDRRIDCMIGEQLWRRYMDGRFPN
jgi:Protein of unknown function (DUF1194)